VAEQLTRRVVVTGLGAVSSLGIGAHAFAASIRAARSGISPISGFDTTGFPHTNAGEVKDFDPRGLLDQLDPDDWGRSSLLAASAARLAVTDAAIDPGRLARSAAGSIMGTTSGESTVVQSLTEQWSRDGMKGLDPRLIGQLPASQIAIAVNHELGLTGDAQTIPTACSASNYALGYAYDLVRTGEADFMLAGGADSVNRYTHAGFYRLGALAESVCRPFDANRTGIITAEGGVALFLEPLETARARGARIYAEVLGYGLNCDADHAVAPNLDSVARCIRLAHRDAGVKPAEIDFISAHGTGTKANDVTEAGAIRQVFGRRPPPTISTKSMIGHAMGAASALSAIACGLAITHRFIPPTINHGVTDPECDLDCVPNTARAAELRVVQNNALAFGGNNAVLILGRYEGGETA